MFKIIKSLSLCIFLALCSCGQNNKDKFTNTVLKKRVVKDTLSFNQVKQLINEEDWVLYNFRNEFFEFEPFITYATDKNTLTTVQDKGWKITVDHNSHVILYDISQKPQREISVKTANRKELLAMGLLLDDLIDYEIKHDLYKNSKARSTDLLMCIYLEKKLKPIKLTDSQISKIKILNKKVAHDIRDTRKDFDIDPEVMYKKDVALIYQKKKKLKGDTLYDATNKTAQFNTLQAEGMVRIEKLRAAYRQDVMNLLTEEQKEKIPGKRKKPTP